MKNTAYVSSEEAKVLRENAEAVHLHSAYNFLGTHNGLRPGCTHVLMGTSGGGKSTLVRSVVRDFALHPKNESKTMLVWLSEESEDEFRAEMAIAVTDNDRMASIKVHSEMNEANTARKLEELLREQEPAVFLYDNITTSRFYQDQKIDIQARFGRWIKRLSKEMSIATVLVAHTGAEVTDSMSRLINMNDIRGSKSIVNLAEFFYILQRFQVGQDFVPTLTIAKNRGQEVMERMFFLEYSKASRCYEKDRAINFKRFKEIYDARNKL